MTDPATARLLMERVAARDEAAFTRLVTAFDADLLRVALLVSEDADAARDAVQATWERAWARPPVLRDQTAIRSWLLKVAANEARQAARRRRRGRALEHLSSRPIVEMGLEAKDRIVDLGSALSRLTASERELLALRYMLDMTSDEIGGHLGITAEGARSRLHRLINRLREEMTND